MVIWSILWQFGIFSGDLVYFMVIWSILPFLVCCVKKNLATLLGCMQRQWLGKLQSDLKLCVDGLVRNRPKHT
jgi:hypothetical protein